MEWPFGLPLLRVLYAYLTPRSAESLFRNLRTFYVLSLMTRVRLYASSSLH